MKRYKAILKTEDSGPGMKQDEYGCWVRHDDFVKYQREVEASLLVLQSTVANRGDPNA